MKPVVLITGAARGIGRAIADDLARDHDVAITFLSAADEAADFARQNPDSLVLPADLSRQPAHDVIKAVIDHFGRLDGVVNNAGIIQLTPIEAFDEQVAMDIMRVNAVAPMALIAAAAPYLPTGAGVVNITSVNAKMPPDTAAIYAASKSALQTITTSCAKALGPKGIRVNAVSPGAVERSHAPRPDDVIRQLEENSALGRLATDSEIAQAVRFLLSPAASGVTGETITVSAGYRL